MATEPSACRGTSGVGVCVLALEEFQSHWGGVGR